MKSVSINCICQTHFSTCSYFLFIDVFCISTVSKRKADRRFYVGVVFVVFLAICCCLRVCVCFSSLYLWFYFYETGINTLISISIRSTNLILASILRVLCHLFWFYIYFYSFGNKSKKMHIWHLTIFLHRFPFAVAVITEQPVHDEALSIEHSSLEIFCNLQFN